MKSYFLFLLIPFLLISMSTKQDYSIKDIKEQPNQIVKLKLKKIQQASLNSKNVTALSENHPAVFKNLQLDGNKISASPKVALYADGDLLMLVKQNDFTAQNDEFDLELKIQAFERRILGSAFGTLLIGTCACAQGRDDCHFIKDNDGDLDCITNGACSDCEFGLTLYNLGVSIEVEIPNP